MTKFTGTLLLLLTVSSLQAEVSRTYNIQKGDRSTTYSDNGRAQDKVVTKVRKSSRRTKVESYNYSTGRYEDTVIRHKR